jgi:hypothetical protein
MPRQSPLPLNRVRKLFKHMRPPHPALSPLATP